MTLAQPLLPKSRRHPLRLPPLQLLLMLKLLLPELAYVFRETADPHGVRPAEYTALGDVIRRQAANQQATQGQDKHIPAEQQKTATSRELFV